ncbi:MAG: tetratricopeptide repeat protein [Bryobacterales bacterium]|nr:tetratricopeptide repeat protein [Bryobacterales bacterium]
MIAPLFLLFAGWDVDDYQRGLELVRAGQWEAARRIFEAAWADSPSDKRYPLELAGIAYHNGNRASAKRYLQHALRLDPHDPYGNDFLGTLYFLDQNTEAALKYWNRIGKPHLGAVSIDPPSPAHAVLLDRAMAFSPAALLKLRDYRTTTARLDALQLFTAYNLELQAKPQEQFDAILHWANPSPWLRIATAAGGLPYQTLYADFRDAAGSGGNWSNLLRWDAQKRRILSSFSAPFRGDPKWRYTVHADARAETWNLDTPADFRMTRIEAGAALRAIPSGRLSWTMALIAASRHFRGAQFAAGFSAKYRAAATLRILDFPEHRFTLDGAGTWDLARLFSAHGGLYSQGQAKLAARWLPQSRGRDYEIITQARAGKTIGQAPFDELFLLGVERDNDLWLRGHAGTRAGKKGSAPIAASYFLSNTELDKQLFQYTLLRVTAGPFFDLGRIQDFRNRFSARSWFADAGVQAKVSLTGAMTLTISYGRDLRGGGRAIYATAGAAR